PRALDAVSEAVAAGERDAAALGAIADATLRAGGIEAEYIAIVDPDSLEPLRRLEGSALLALAARVGEVRLIDNALLDCGIPHGDASLNHDEGASIAGGDPEPPLTPEEE
ncbi:MAG: pantoate--beta-alanine ligase, partial [Leucobacter sp.]